MHLGATGISVSRLGLGLAAVGRPGYINLGRSRDLPDRSPDALYARAAELLDFARTRDIRYVDVARSYGRAEEFLARWLRTVQRDTFAVGSKWGYRYTAGWRVDAPVHEEKELSVTRFTTQIGETRALLGDRLDLYQIHSATPESVEDTTLLRALVDGRRARAYRAVGLTLSGTTSARALALALAARVDGERVFDVVHATFNCLEPSLAEALARAHGEGVGVIVKEALANGRLTPANARPEDESLVRGLRATAAARSCSMDQLALAFVLERPWVDVVLSGAATTAQLVSHTDALAVELDDRTRALLARLAEPPARYWTTRASLPWT
ncbi:MAG TPA: aldo/keto reductase [Candidatus Binatia bacterium]|nr:aldo/keto reductase [Candidatus Binatia bacterium]